MSRRTAVTRRVRVAALAGVVLAVVAVLLLVRGGSGGDDEPPALLEERVGRGPVTTTILRPAAGASPLPVVLFLHGWGATRPESYRPWLEHLARRGNAVLYPRYQDSVATPPPQVLGNVLAGVRLALSRLDEDPRSLVAVGHSAGGALASDYAAIARRVALPVPRAVLSAYPGRSLRGFPARIPAVQPVPDGIPVLALGSTQDAVVGTSFARDIARSAPDGRYVEVRTAGARDHLAPQRADAVARRVFWARLDRLIDSVRR